MLQIYAESVVLALKHRSSTDYSFGFICIALVLLIPYWVEYL